MVWFPSTISIHLKLVVIHLNASVYCGFWGYLQPNWDTWCRCKIEWDIYKDCDFVKCTSVSSFGSLSPTQIYHLHFIHFASREVEPYKCHHKGTLCNWLQIEAQPMKGSERRLESRRKNNSEYLFLCSLPSGRSFSNRSSVSVIVIVLSGTAMLFDLVASVSRLSMPFHNWQALAASPSTAGSISTADTFINIPSMENLEPYEWESVSVSALVLHMSMTN